MMNYKCPNCNGMEGTKIITYKHYWISCNQCGTVVRERRGHYPFNNWLFRSIIQNSKLRFIYGNTLLPIKEVIDEDKHFYDYYHDTAKQGVQGTRWEKDNKEIFTRFEKYNITVKNKSILDISGGPGFLTKDLSEISKRAVVTEFSQHAVDGMKNALQIEAVKFDYNSDRINECIHGKFDIILIIYSIGFCNDIRSFIQSLKEILHQDGVVYLCYSPPTLGLMMRWQFDDYTYNRCWPVEVITKNFTEIGMKEIIRDDAGAFRYDENWFDKGRNRTAKILNGFHRTIGHYYLKRALKKKNINKELVQKNVLQIFKF